MGHLTLMAEDVIMALERFPPELRLKLIEYAPDPEWDEYVTGRYNETKKRDTRLLGGGKPILSSPGAPRSVGRWKIDEDDTSPTSDAVARVNGHETRGEFRRAGGQRLTRESSADFGPAAMQDDVDEEEESNPATPHVRFLLHI
jgi:serine/threonine-protein phosphatase 6 regulatory subunit 3